MTQHVVVILVLPQAQALVLPPVQLLAVVQVQGLQMVRVQVLAEPKNPAQIADSLLKKLSKLSLGSLEGFWLYSGDVSGFAAEIRGFAWEPATGEPAIKASTGNILAVID